MVNIFNKIWLFGGWFYITLFLAVAASLLFLQKFTRQVYKVVVIIAVFFALYASGLEIQSRIVKDFPLFFNPVDEKIERETKNLRSFAQEVKKVLPSKTTGCLYRYWDTQSAYLVQELYPHIFRPITDDALTTGCKYIISPSRPRPNLKEQLLLDYKNNYLYKDMQ